MKDCKKLNEYLSNLAILNAKLHNLHWNVKGIHFMEIHQFTESLYNDFFEKYDEVAELLKMRDEKPLVKLSDYIQNSSIKELDGKDFSSDEVIKIVQEDLNTMKNLAIEIRNAANEDNDFEVVSAFEEHVSGYSKNLWFIKSMLA
ncbi:Dps family protein [Clostridium sp.]|jgi:starvation-inducible DNA-binding protein|uniref:Dps family protein n=1 Tax=Clostridium sp. TaxID=1506 RepID=UPI0039F61649